MSNEDALGEPIDAATLVRVQRPSRRVSTGVVVAGADGRGVHLPATAAAAWELLAEPTTSAAIVAALRARHPEVPDDEVATAVDEILGVMEREGIVRRG